MQGQQFGFNRAGIMPVNSVLLDLSTARSVASVMTIIHHSDLEQLVMDIEVGSRYLELSVPSR